MKQTMHDVVGKFVLRRPPQFGSHSAGSLRTGDDVAGQPTRPGLHLLGRFGETESDYISGPFVLQPLLVDLCHRSITNEQHGNLRFVDTDGRTRVPHQLSNPPHTSLQPSLAVGDLDHNAFCHEAVL